MEDSIRTALTRDFEEVLPGAKITELECRTMTCRMVVSANDYGTLQKAITVAQYAPLAPLSKFGGGGALDRTIYMVFTPETHSVENYRAWYRKMREGALPDIRSGRAANDPPVPTN